VIPFGLGLLGGEIRTFSTSWTIEPGVTMRSPTTKIYVTSAFTTLAETREKRAMPTFERGADELELGPITSYIHSTSIVTLREFGEEGHTLLFG
jgi:hypothetical protein